jgi:hypothetical protein
MAWVRILPELLANKGFSTLKMDVIRTFETSVLEDLLGATSQKTIFFIVTVVKISDHR